MDMRTRSVLIGMGGIIVVASLVLGAQALHITRVMASTRAALDKGFPALAFERLDPYRTSVISRKDGCSLLLDTYYAARRADRLEWSAESCIDGGKESAEAFIGLAASYELIGQEAQAAQILQAGIRKFETSASLYWHLGQIFRRNKNIEEASRLFMIAVEHAPDDKRMILGALQYFVEVKQNDHARLMATRLKSMSTDSAEVKLLIARGLKQGGDAAGAKIVAQEAIPLMAILSPQVKAQLEEDYKDVIVR